MDPNIIAILIPCGDPAVKICYLPHNLRLQPKIRPQVAPRLQLTFREEPKVPQNGYSFGTNPQCDIWLGEGEKDISRQQFCISFDTERNLVLKDTSQAGTRVSYGGEFYWRQDFTWILDIHKKHRKISKDVWVKFGDLKFKIEVPNHEDCSEYRNNLDDFLRKGRGSVLTLNALSIDTIKETRISRPSSSKTKEAPKGPVYLRIKEIGRGAYGEVCKVINVSTGKDYARKTFLQTGLERKTWLKIVKNEIEIMHKYKHVSVDPPLTKLELIIWKKHIMPVEGEEWGNEPWLLMPYYRLGNLSDQSKSESLTRKEIEDILFQMLEVLVHLHPVVAHRDLKPENILVESRDPSIRIRIADFGLAKVTEGTNLKTGKGTFFYMAPEVGPNDQNYSPSVDLWSAGVIVLKYAYGLPKCQNWGNWCQDIFNHAQQMDGASDPLLKILQTGMLKMEAEKRLSAHECLKRVKTELFSNDNLDIGGTTRAEGTTLRCEIVDKKSSITVMRGALQSKEKRLFAHECLKRIKTDLFSNDNLDIGGTTRAEGTTLRCEIADKKSSITVMGGAPQSKEPTRVVYSMLQRTAQQDNVVDDSGSPSHQDEGVLGGQNTSNLDNNDIPASVLGEKDCKSNEQSAGHPITPSGQAPVNKRDITTVLFSDSHRSKRRRKSTGPTNPSRRLS